MQVYDKKKRESLIAASKSSLEAKSWVVKDVGAKSFNYSATKGQLSFMVECIDSSVFEYKSPSLVINYIEGQADSFRNFGVPSVFIFDDTLRYYDFSSILSRRILAVVLSDIGVLSSLDRLVSELPSNLLPFEYLFAQKSVAVANVLSQMCKKMGDLNEAVAWAERAVAAAPRAIGTQYRLIELLRAQGDTARAAAACRDALRLNPNATGLVNIMRDLAKETGDKTALDYLNHYVEDRPQKGSSAEFLLSGRPIAAPPTQNVHPSSSDKDVKRRGWPR